jgi:hypothetical protein
MRTIAIIAALSSLSVAIGCHSFPRAERASVEEPAPLTLEELIAAVRESRAALSEIDVEYSFNVLEGPEGAITHNSVHVHYRDGKVIIDHWYGLNAERLFHRVSGYDGEVRWMWGPNTGGAILFTKTPEQAGERRLANVTTEGTGLFDLMRWYPCQQARFGTPHHYDLLVMLKAGHYGVREGFEYLGDSRCIVVDWICQDTVCTGATTIWIDPDRGYLPILQRHYGGPRLTMEMRIDEAAEVVPGVWIPTKGTRFVPANPSVTYVMEVGRVAINAGVLGADDFRYEARFSSSQAIDLDSIE